MKRFSIREWSYVAIGEAETDAPLPSVTRVEADHLIRVAQRASQQLKLGGDDGAAVLADGNKRMRAGQVVGIVAAPGISLEILPKIDGLDDGATRTNLVRMLARVLDLRISDGTISQLGWQRHDLLEVLIRLFCDWMFEAVHRGMPRRYVHMQDDLRALRGRLDVKRQFTSLATAPQTLACRYEELSLDIPLNQIMKAAITKLRKLSRAADNQRHLFELELAFADVSSLPETLLRWDAVVLDRTNNAWQGLLKLAKLLLWDRFQNTTFGDASGFSLLFEMNTLFEEFIGRTIQGALRPEGFLTQLQGPRNFVLIDTKGSRRFATRPDIYISNSDGERWIIDTKWKQLSSSFDDPKQGISQADVYQMIAYAQVYQCKRLMLLYPHHKSLGMQPGILSEYTIAGTTDTRLYAASVDLTEIATVPRQLVMCLEALKFRAAAS